MINLKRVGQIASKKHILFVVDASQTAGVYPIDVQELGVDVLGFTGHKGLLEPAGTGGLYVRKVWKFVRFCVRKWRGYL